MYLKNDVILSTDIKDDVILTLDTSKLCKDMPICHW